jgi:uncharacterized protein (UPF0276 family)
MKKMNPVPVLLERDFYFPELDELKTELSALRSIVNKNQNHHVIH